MTPCRRVHAHDRKLFWPRGKTLGGSSSLNGMIYVRGHASVYDAWERQGNPGWGYQSVLPYFKKSEDMTGAPMTTMGPAASCM